MLPAVWVPWLVLAFGPACVEPDTPPVETGEAYPAPGFPFPTRKGHQVVGDPEDHAERGQPSAWDLDCILEDGVGAVAGGTVVSVRDGLPSGEAYGDGNEVCIRQGSTRITFCHSRLQAGSLAELATGDVVMLGHRLGGCGASGRPERPGKDTTHLEIRALDDQQAEVRLAHPDRWVPLATLYEPDPEPFAVTHPAGGESFPLGSTLDVTWEDAGLEAVVEVVAYRGPRGGGLAEERVIALESAGENDGLLEGVELSTDWARMAEDWYVCVDAGFVGDCGGFFEITSDATLDLTAPLGGERFEIGGVFDIAWTRTGEVGPVDVWICNGPKGACEAEERVRQLVGDGDPDAALDDVPLDPAWAWDDEDWYVCVEGPGARDCSGGFTLFTPVVPLTVGCGGDYETLQAAVDAAKDGDSVEICPGTFVGPTRIVALQLTIQGAGEEATVLTASSDEIVLEVDSGADVTLRDLTVADAACPGGEACALKAGASRLALQRVTVRDTSGARSPGISLGSASLSIDRVTVSRVHATDGSAGAGIEALYSSIVGGDLVVESCTAQEGVGGGLHAEGSDVNLVDAWFLGDSADQAGGAIYARSASTLSLTGGGISECTAGEGGALFASRSSMVSLAGMTVQANRATSGSGGGFSLLAETPTDITTLTLTACDLGEKSSDNEPADLQVTAEDGTTATCSYGGVTTLSVTVDSPACP